MLQFIVNVIAKGHLDQVELFQLVPQTKTVVQSAKPKKNCYCFNEFNLSLCIACGDQIN